MFGNSWTFRNTEIYAAFNGTSINLKPVINALLSYLQYEMYWYDKVSGVSGTYLSDNSKIAKIELTFSVVGNY